MQVFNPINPQCASAYLASPCCTAMHTPCGTILTASQVGYNGPNLPCTGVQTCNNMELALQKIDNTICEMKSASQYKEFYGLVTQSGFINDAPDVTELINTIGPITWEYSGVGIYFGNLPNGFTDNTFIEINQGFSFNIPVWSVVDVNQIAIGTYDPVAEDLVDGGFVRGAIHIIVFPTTTTTTTTAPITTTTTSTTVISIANDMSLGHFTTVDACDDLVTGLTLYTQNALGIGEAVFSDNNRTTPFNGLNTWYHLDPETSNNLIFLPLGSNIVSILDVCPSTTTSTTTL